ncbi:uncharacterized protein B0T15DRAFT_485581 [Chaetomium strumarium]|uniref:Uncharacterized protein n=1 Tax=Chaetomium strumarium TaxID=1170767 RepID=A0AAJ0GU65_9PEZI|nr:hypothetical protein B0T15DRAFT_485581 [Chaetomium strumarium]
MSMSAGSLTVGIKVSPKAGCKQPGLNPVSLRPILVEPVREANIICRVATAWPIFTFFASNYLAHCATFRTYPGSSTLDIVLGTALALFLPSSGISRALFWILRHPSFRRNRNELERAVAAGALRLLVRNREWRPEAGDRIRPIRIACGRPRLDTSESATPTTAGVSVSSDDLLSYDDLLSAPGSFSAHTLRNPHKLHGKALLPPGYSWFAVHHEAKVLWAEPSRECDDMKGRPPGISSNYTWIQSLIAIFQAGSAALTLYNSRGNQIQRYGYAAFGLTVVPYLVMSLWNLVAQIATAEYPTVYMVDSPEMEEARRRGGVFDGVVGMLEPEVSDEDDDANVLEYAVKRSADGVQLLQRISGSNTYPPVVRFVRAQHGDEIIVPRYTPYKRYSSSPHGEGRLVRLCALLRSYLTPVIVSCLPLLVAGLLTHFDSGESTPTQRGWIMTWLVVGIVMRWPTDFWVKVKIGTSSKAYALFFAFIGVSVVLVGLIVVTTIGGFINVAGMLRET